MARFLTVSLECKSDTVRVAFVEILTARRGIILSQTKGQGSADMVVIELDEGSPQRTFTAIRSTLSAAAQTEIFLTASRTDPQVILEAFRIGVKEFIPQPLNRQEVETALTRFEERAKAKILTNEKKAGVVVSMLGAKGGIGTSTVATNLAISLRQIAQHKSVALVDLNRHDSDLPLFLDLPAPRGLRDLSDDISRLDETILQSVLAKHESGIDLLPSGYDGMDGIEPVPGCVLRTLDLMRSLYDYVLVDCGHILENGTREALDYSSSVMVVMTLNLPTIRRTKRLLELLRAAHYGSDKILLVVNRHSKEDEEILRHTEESLEHKIAGLIPNGYATVNQAISNGKSLKAVAPKAAVTQWYLQQASVLAARHNQGAHHSEAEPEKKSSFFARYLPSFGFDAKAKNQVF
ncbi:MAG: AAA family ATPase [Nitrospiraceae bacterium]